MGSEGDYQQWMPERNGKQMAQLSPLYAPGIGEPDEEKLDIRQALAIVRRRFLVITAVAIAVTGGVVAKILSQLPNYEGRFQLLVGPVTGQENKLEQLNQSLSQASGTEGNSVDYSTQIKVLWSPQVMSPIIEQIKARYPEVDYNTLQRQITISRLAETKILEVRYQDSDPERIKFILEKIAQGYIRYSINEQQTSVRQGIQFVEDQIPKLKIRVDKLQENLQIFRQRYNLIEPESQGKLLSDRVSEIGQQRLEIQTKLEENRALYTTLVRQLGLDPQQAIAAAALSEAPRYQKLLDQLQEVESKIAIELARFQEESPTIQALRDQRENLLPLLQEEAQRVVGVDSSAVDPQMTSPSAIRLDLIGQLVQSANQMRVLEVRQVAIVQAENLMSQQLKQMAVIARQYTDLQRDLQVATESFNRFLAIRETLQIEAAQKTLPWQIIAPPQQPTFPISPNVPRSVILGVVAGLLAGAGAALLAEKLDNVFHSADELKDAARLPILGRIPFKKKLKRSSSRAVADSINVSSEENVVFDRNSRTNRYNASPFSEAFRSLHANIHFLSPDRPIRSLVISSSTPADGKSTVSTNLASAAAAMGQRVLLVDADMRIPNVHRLMDLPNVWGLSNVISTDINVDDVIQRSPQEDNLFILTAGQIPPDPTRLLSSKKMQHLIEQLQANFDLVIYDTPPLLGLADARLLSAYTDGLVVVVGLGRTNKEALRQVLDGLRTSRAPVLGMVANGIKDYTDDSSYYYHRYYTQTPSQEILSEDTANLR